jgi:hypothetical protein
MTHIANLADLMPEGEPQAAGTVKQGRRPMFKSFEDERTEFQAQLKYWCELAQARERELARASRDKAALLVALRQLSAGMNDKLDSRPQVLAWEVADARKAIAQAEKGQS